MFKLKRFLLPGLLACSVAVAATITASFVDPTSVIEVGDGNTAPNGGSPNCDWDTLNGTNPANGSNTPAAVCGGAGASINAYVFLKGDLNEKNFTQGGSKDPHDVTDWHWTVSSTPDKDTLTNGYAVSYSVGGHKILAFGAERFAVNGDANIGVWFFQEPVGPNASGAFDGKHTKGDVFAVSAFTNGGGHPNLDVYAWDPGCTGSSYKVFDSTGNLLNGVHLPTCGDTNLMLIFHGNQGDLCSNDPGCDTVNGTGITTAWPYATKFGGGTTVPPNGFFEGGFDLTAIFPGGTPGCFSSFLVETRSSQEPSAVLKDFLSGNFPECHISIAKSCACTAFHTADAGYDYSVGGTVTNDGGGNVFDVVVTDASINATYNCGTLAKGQVKKWGAGAGAGDCTGGVTSFSSLLKPATNQATVTAKSTEGGGDIPSATTDVVTCAVPAGVCQPNPAIAVTKQCVTGVQVLGSNVVLRVDYAGLVTNTGNDNLNSVSVTDTAPGNPGTQAFTIGTLTPGQAKCYTSGNATCPNLGTVAGATPVAGSASYFPSSFVDLGTGAFGRASFTDHVHAVGTDPHGVTLTADADATCRICPAGVCPAQ